MTTCIYRELQVGTQFRSPRPEEGIVKVVCRPGRCTHDTSRDEYGCHVRNTSGSEFFVNWMPNEEVELA